MKANELRMGNYVSRESSDYPQRVDGIKTYRIWMTCIGSSCDLSDVIQNIKPIPLTEEWLLKFGFEKPVYINVGLRFKWIKGKFGLVQIFWKDTDIDSNEDFALWKTPSGELNCYAHGEVPKIKYVHQLQNLYHALTGEELELKD
jgi:hypothetical protein